MEWEVRVPPNRSLGGNPFFLKAGHLVPGRPAPEANPFSETRKGKGSGLVVSFSSLPSPTSASCKEGAGGKIIRPLDLWVPFFPFKVGWCWAAAPEARMSLVDCLVFRVLVQEPRMPSTLVLSGVNTAVPAQSQAPSLAVAFVGIMCLALVQVCQNSWYQRI